MTETAEARAVPDGVLGEAERGGLRWPAPFTTPGWVDAWASTVGRGDSVTWIVPREGNTPIAALPVVLRGDEARVAGSPDLCDYADLAVSPGREREGWEGVRALLRDRGVRRLTAEAVRPDADLLRAARATGCEVRTTPAGVTVEMPLPPTWEGYLSGLPKHERHEVRRKIRRLGEAGSVTWRRSRRPDADLTVFFRLFAESRPDKGAFLTPARRAFFERIARVLAAAGALDLGVLEVDGEPVAATFGFTWDDTAYLYNNGFAPAWAGRSAGLVAKTFSIRDAIERGCRRYSFLRGDEPYKFRLGGRPVPLLGLTVRP
ncbi:GNAT family N-acetyltransferase [Deferrisoma sp.]